MGKFRVVFPQPLKADSLGRSDQRTQVLEQWSILPNGQVHGCRHLTIALVQVATVISLVHLSPSQTSEFLEVLSKVPSQPGAVVHNQLQDQVQAQLLEVNAKLFMA